MHDATVKWNVQINTAWESFIDPHFSEDIIMKVS
jgi:hypothetical protein